jgi:cytochrome oxidase Cu insertion factor (SCO1/SenC/PrrC family)
MKRVLALLVLLAATPVVAPLAQEAQKPEMAKMSLKVGDIAPDFTLPSDQGKPVTLSDYRGKQNVFLAVYVLAFTGG